MRKRKIIFVIACVLFLLALTWTVLVSNGLLDKTDESIVEFTIKYRGEKYNFVYWFTRIITEGAYVYFIIPFLIIILLIYHFDLKSMILAVGTPVQLLVNTIIKNIVKRQRPNEIYHWMSEKSFSFPSGHSMTASFLYGFLIYMIWGSKLSLRKKVLLSSISGLMMILIFFSRIILSVHFTSDVLGGILWGGFLVMIAIMVNEYFGKKHNGLRNIIDSKLKVGQKNED